MQGKLGLYRIFKNSSFQLYDLKRCCVADQWMESSMALFNAPRNLHDVEGHMSLMKLGHAYACLKINTRLMECSVQLAFCARLGNSSIARVRWVFYGESA